MRRAVVGATARAAPSKSDGRLVDDVLGIGIGRTEVGGDGVVVGIGLAAFGGHGHLRDGVGARIGGTEGVTRGVAHACGGIQRVGRIVRGDREYGLLTAHQTGHLHIDAVRRAVVGATARAAPSEGDGRLVDLVGGHGRHSRLGEVPAVPSAGVMGGGALVVLAVRGIVDKVTHRIGGTRAEHGRIGEAIVGGLALTAADAVEGDGGHAVGARVGGAEVVGAVGLAARQVLRSVLVGGQAEGGQLATLQTADHGVDAVRGAVVGATARARPLDNQGTSRDNVLTVGIVDVVGQAVVVFVGLTVLDGREGDCGDVVGARVDGREGKATVRHTVGRVDQRIVGISRGDREYGLLAAHQTRESHGDALRRRSVVMRARGIGPSKRQPFRLDFVFGVGIAVAEVGSDRIVGGLLTAALDRADRHRRDGVGARVDRAEGVARGIAHAVGRIDQTVGRITGGDREYGLFGANQARYLHVDAVLGAIVGGVAFATPSEGDGLFVDGVVAVGGRHVGHKCVVVARALLPVLDGGQGHRADAVGGHRTAVDAHVGGREGIVAVGHAVRIDQCVILVVGSRRKDGFLAALQTADRGGDAVRRAVEGSATRTTPSDGDGGLADSIFAVGVRHVGHKRVVVARAGIAFLDAAEADCGHVLGAHVGEGEGIGTVAHAVRIDQRVVIIGIGRGEHGLLAVLQARDLHGHTLRRRSVGVSARRVGPSEGDGGFADGRLAVGVRHVVGETVVARALLPVLDGRERKRGHVPTAHVDAAGEGVTAVGHAVGGVHQSVGGIGVGATEYCLLGAHQARHGGRDGIGATRVGQRLAGTRPSNIERLLVDDIFGIGAVGAEIGGDGVVARLGLAAHRGQSHRRDGIGARVGGAELIARAVGHAVGRVDQGVGRIHGAAGRHAEHGLLAVDQARHLHVDAVRRAVVGGGVGTRPSERDGCLVDDRLGIGVVGAEVSGDGVVARLGLAAHRGQSHRRDGIGARVGGAELIARAVGHAVGRVDQGVGRIHGAAGRHAEHGLLAVDQARHLHVDAVRRAVVGGGAGIRPSERDGRLADDRLAVGIVDVVREAVVILAGLPVLDGRNGQRGHVVGTCVRARSKGIRARGHAAGCVDQRVGRIGVGATEHNRLAAYQARHGRGNRTRGALARVRPIGLGARPRDGNAFLADDRLAVGVRHVGGERIVAGLPLAALDGGQSKCAHVVGVGILAAGEGIAAVGHTVGCVDQGVGRIGVGATEHGLLAALEARDGRADVVDGGRIGQRGAGARPTDGDGRLADFPSHVFGVILGELGAVPIAFVRRGRTSVDFATIDDQLAVGIGGGRTESRRRVGGDGAVGARGTVGSGVTAGQAVVGRGRTADGVHPSDVVPRVDGTAGHGAIAHRAGLRRAGQGQGDGVAATDVAGVVGLEVEGAARIRLVGRAVPRDGQLALADGEFARVGGDAQSVVGRNARNLDRVSVARGLTVEDLRRVAGVVLRNAA